MKVVILAGGFGTRFEEETFLKPKPMIEVGGRPILWHIMKIYDHYGFRDFIICLGYKGYLIKEFFYNYLLHNSDITVDMRTHKIRPYKINCEPWKVTLIDTGLDTMTGGRIKRIQPYVDRETFMVTYGDGLSNINIRKLLEHHKRHAKYATLTAVKPLGRFGSIGVNKNNIVVGFQEKPRGDGAWINGGFFVLEPEIFDYIEGDHTMWEAEPLENLTKDHKLVAYKHDGFWMCMDTMREKKQLEELWESGSPPWKLWEK